MVAEDETGFDLCSAGNEHLRPLYALAIDWRRKLGATQRALARTVTGELASERRRCRARGDS